MHHITHRHLVAGGLGDGCRPLGSEGAAHLDQLDPLGGQLSGLLTGGLQAGHPDGGDQVPGALKIGAVTGGLELRAHDEKGEMQEMIHCHVLL